MKPPALSPTAVTAGLASWLSAILLGGILVLGAERALAHELLPEQWAAWVRAMGVPVWSWAMARWRP